MSDSNNSGKRSWFTTLKAEFKKVIWPDKKDLTKQTIVVLVTALVIGVIVAFIDMGIQYGIQFLMQ